MIIVFACGMYVDQVRRGQTGKEAFLAKQSLRYDRFFATPPMTLDFVSAVLVGGTMIAIYELVAFGTLMFLDRIGPKDPD